ncbi:MAG: hypothetical protein EOP48_10575 [Sphingobacteriales bacterium]|nr:MAG: hypothetical protein EOP48_10575 [Sphingobacteriales bacterium]
MKFITTTLIGLTILSLSSCKKISEALQTNVSSSPKVVNFEIPILAQSSSEITYKEVAVKINMDSLVKVVAPSFGASNIKSIKLKSFKVEFSEGDNANNFANFESIKGRIMADGQPGLDIVSIANNPDVTSSALIFPISEGLELKDYLSGGSFRYVLKGKVRRATTKVLKAQAYVVYDFTLGM